MCVCVRALRLNISDFTMRIRIYMYPSFRNDKPIKFNGYFLEYIYLCVCELHLALKIYYPLNHHRIDVFSVSSLAFLVSYSIFFDSFLWVHFLSPVSDRQFNINFSFMFTSHFSKKKNDPKKTLVLN